MDESEVANSLNQDLLERILDGIEWVATIIEILAVAVIAFGVAYAFYQFLSTRFREEHDSAGNLKRFRAQLGNSLLIGLEILVAADIIRTVALEPSLTNVAVLGILVLVRTFLSWSTVVEIEGRWPWKTAEAEERAAESGASGGGGEKLE